MLILNVCSLLLQIVSKVLLVVHQMLRSYIDPTDRPFRLTIIVLQGSKYKTRQLGMIA
jgi:hypothetical protein